ncbi:MAG: hypothetical protein AAFY73_10110 [Pseudomonadota bacterium]
MPNPTKNYRIDGVNWQLNQTALPQSTLSARANDGEKLAIVMPKDWNLPIQAKDNAVLMSRTIDSPRWKQSSAMDYRDAVKRGSNTVKEYENDKQIAAMKAEEYSPQMAKSIRAINRNEKPVKLTSRKGRERLNAASELYQDRGGQRQAGQKAASGSNGKDWDMEM